MEVVLVHLFLLMVYGVQNQGGCQQTDIATMESCVRSIDRSNYCLRMNQ